MNWKQKEGPAQDKDTQLFLEYGKTGNPAIFSRLFKKYSPKTKALIALLAGLEKMDTEDIIQKVFMKVIEKRKEFVPTAKFSTWLYALSFNTTLTHIRNRKNMEAFDNERDAINTRTPMDDTLGTERREHLILAMERISPRQKEAVILREFAGISYQDIGEIMNISKSAVESLIFHGRQNLKKILGSMGHGKS